LLNEIHDPQPTGIGAVIGNIVAERPCMASEVVRWVLCDGDRQLTCVLRELAGGSELAIVYYDGLPLRTRVCLNGADSMQWTNDVRDAWIAHGWTPGAQS
jgi:hypothetical protein